MKSLARQFFFDSTTITLLGSNLLTIIIALWEGWPLSEIMWIYWGQSVMIGLFSFCRILDLKQFSTRNVYEDGKPVPPTHKTKIKLAFLFLLHYGGFHLVYLVFLASEHGSIALGSLLGFFLCIFAFLLNHLFSFVRNRQRDRSRTPNIGLIFLFPYARILPMHLTIIIGGALGAHSRILLVFFLLLKTLADVIMHMVEHADARFEEIPDME